MSFTDGRKSRHQLEGRLGEPQNSSGSGNEENCNLHYIEGKFLFIHHTLFLNIDDLELSNKMKWCRQQATGVKAKQILTDDFTNFQCEKKNYADVVRVFNA